MPKSTVRRIVSTESADDGFNMPINCNAFGGTPTCGPVTTVADARLVLEANNLPRFSYSDLAPEQGFEP
jgi:hypothetical protein